MNKNSSVIEFKNPVKAGFIAFATAVYLTMVGLDVLREDFVGAALVSEVIYYSLYLTFSIVVAALSLLLKKSQKLDIKNIIFKIRNHYRIVSSVVTIFFVILTLIKTTPLGEFVGLSKSLSNTAGMQGVEIVWGALALSILIYVAIEKWMSIKSDNKMVPN